MFRSYYIVFSGHDSICCPSGTEGTVWRPGNIFGVTFPMGAIAFFRFKIEASLSKEPYQLQTKKSYK
jgi:hypothetical protein